MSHTLSSDNQTDILQAPRFGDHNAVEKGVNLNRGLREYLELENGRTDSTMFDGDPGQSYYNPD